MKVRSLVAPLLAMAVGATLAGGRGARAEMVYELLPTLAVGVTDNAAATASQNMPAGDEFGTVAGTARARYRGPRADHALGYRVTETDYLHGKGTSALSQELAWLSAFTLSATLDLRLGVTGAYAHTARPAGVDVNTALPAAQIARDNRFFTAAANQGLSYRSTPVQRYVETLHFSGVHYLPRPVDPANPVPPPALPNTLSFGTLLHAERDVGRNVLSAEADVTDSYSPNRGAGIPDHTLLVQTLVGWQRDLSATWSLALQGGALGVFDLQGTGVVRPTAVATVNYRRIDWFATLTASQTAAPNLFLGTATINDHVALHLALPLTKSELYYVLGYGGYTYARLANSQSTGLAYELRTGGVSLTARSERLPFWAALDYTISSQLGNLGEGGTIPDLRRQTLLLTIGGAFVFGPGTPPLFHGVLSGNVRPPSN